MFLSPYKIQMFPTKCGDITGLCTTVAIYLLLRQLPSKITLTDKWKGKNNTNIYEGLALNIHVIVSRNLNQWTKPRTTYF